MSKVNIKINGIPYEVDAGITILEACMQVGIKIPTLCYLKGINEIGACRICLVEVKGAKALVASCVYPVNDGMEIRTNTEQIRKSRKTTLELILSNHDKKCLSCERSGRCELQDLCHEYGLDDSDAFEGIKNEYEIDTSCGHLIRNNNKCVLCRRCEAACANQFVGVIGSNDRGFDTNIGCAFDKKLGDVPCVNCGQCIVACPTGALTDKTSYDEIFAAIEDPAKHVVFQTAPSIRATLGEYFGMEPGTNVEGKMVAAIRRLGADKVFDTDFGADLTILEEANEFIERVQNGGVLPLITSCSPGWVKFAEFYHPDMLENISSCKSPQQMTGAVIKTWYAEKNGIDPKDIVVVSVMPCSAKKMEKDRDNQNAAGVPDVDFAITTRELGMMIERSGIDFKKLPDEQFDPALDVSTGAAVIFGATGGVMEAALRTAVEKLTGEELKQLEFKDVRGTDGIKEATYNVAGMDVNVCVCSGLANADKVLNMVKSGEKNYHFIEIMCCPGGCVNGGGQPIQPAYVRNTVDLKAVRAAALYAQDEAMPLRKSHDSPVVKMLYDEYFEKPGSHKAHEILHTTYKARKKY